MLVKINGQIVFANKTCYRGYFVLHGYRCALRLCLCPLVCLGHNTLFVYSWSFPLGTGLTD